jgi:ATP-dependent DNA ligase
MAAARRRSGIRAGAIASEELTAVFPDVDLPVRPPFPPMEATASSELPPEGEWLYEPKWDGFRCLAFRDRAVVTLQSKSGQPLGRYFPEVLDALAALAPQRFVLDGEIVVAGDGELSFDDLLQRIHPAESRVRRLARETPASLLVFDLLVDADGTALVDRPLVERRVHLERFFARTGGSARIMLSPVTREIAMAERWLRELGASGLDGIVAKRLDEPYRSGDRSAMRKVKRIRTADCVVGGFRYTQKGGEVGSLLLGLYDTDGLLHHVGFAASFTRTERAALRAVVEPLIESPGFTGSAPGGPSRWASERSTEWQPLRPVLVCEVRYDHFSGDRFRHGTKFLRWRPDKDPRQCTFDQLAGRGANALDTLGLPPAGAA